MSKEKQIQEYESKWLIDELSKMPPMVIATAYLHAINYTLYDAEMNDLIKDLCDVLHDLEWWQSADSSEERYRDTLAKFKAKWFRGSRQERLKGYIDEQISIVRSQLYSLIGKPQPILDKIVNFIEDNYPTEIRTDWERGCAYGLDEIEKIVKSESEG